MNLRFVSSSVIILLSIPAPDPSTTEDADFIFIYSTFRLFRNLWRVFFNKNQSTRQRVSLIFRWGEESFNSSLYKRKYFLNILIYSFYTNLYKEDSKISY